jgi:hypothetical protein
MRPLAGSVAVALAVMVPVGCEDYGATAIDDGGTDGGTAGDEADDGDGIPPDGVHYLDPADHLVRISMALRGKRPSPDEIAAVQADPAAIEGIVDGYLEDPAFGETMRDLHNDALLVLADYFIYPAGFPAMDTLAGVDPYVLNRSIMEAPLRLAEYVVMEDRPYTEIVTADYTLANGPMATVWGLPYDGDGMSWELSQWTDGRKNAGVLSDSWLFQRHSSTISNANRGRANAISRALLCYDFLSRDIEVDASINLADPEVVANAVMENPACASCHQGLDPLASFFRGYYPTYVPADNGPYPFETYVENLFPQYLGVTMRDPTFFGVPGDGLDQLGALIAADPRFSLCAAKRFYAFFNQVEVEDVPLMTASELQRAFLDSGMNAKALAKAVVLDDAFRISHVDEGVDLEIPAIRKTRPLQLQQLVRSLTGFVWETDLAPYGAPELGRVNLLEDSFLGYQVLAGGVDSVFVTRPTKTMSATSSLVLRNLARVAAGEVVDRDFTQPDLATRQLLTLVTAEDTDEGVVRDQLAALHLKIYGRPDAPDGEAVGRTWGLWSGVLQTSGDPVRAWKITVMAMLQDVSIAYY